MDDLLAFVRARLDERELMLRTVSPAQIAWATFRHADGSMRYTSVASSNGDAWVCAGCAVEPDSVQVVFDRSQELADVAAKRQIIKLHRPYQVTTADDGLNWCYTRCAGCEPIDRELEPNESYWPCPNLRLLALPFAGHPDYDERWRP